MKIIDITQPLLNCKVYPGDPEPKLERICETAKNNAYNLSSLSMCLHNGTHIDAPFHFIDSGKTVDKIDLSAFVGDCFVARERGEINDKKAREILDKARSVGAEKRILIAGEITVTEEGAKVFADSVTLLGNESQSVGPLNAPMPVHLILLGRGVVLLEGIVLDGVKEGKYFLSASLKTTNNNLSL